MSDGISNTQIQNFFEKEQNEDIRNNFMGVFSMDWISKYIKSHELIKQRNRRKYLFAIFNTDANNKPGTHWWSFLDIQPKKNLLLFDSHSLEGFKYFIVDNNEKIINELLYNIKKCKTDDASQKIKLCTMTSDSSIWDKLAQNKKEQLNETARNFFHLLYQFAKLKKSSTMNIIMVEIIYKN